MDHAAPSHTRDIPIEIVGEQSNGGTYVLRIRVCEDIALAFGCFNGGKALDVKRGDYLYVGSALSERGATTLARRLGRHATRCGNKPPHRIRRLMLRRFNELQLAGMIGALTRGKRLHWHVDYLLDSSRVELVGVYALRDQARIEGVLAKLLEQDPATSIIKKGLGASDLRGNTHLLGVDADELWWRLLPKRMQRLASPLKTENLVEMYLRGRRCIPSHSEQSLSRAASFAKGNPAREAAQALSARYAVPEELVIAEAKFGLAVNSILSNCGNEAIEAIFSLRIPQTQKAIEELARTSDVRQRHRIQGLLAGRFRSLAPQNDDSVFDTVKFAEVNSRLFRAAGQLRKWAASHQMRHGAESKEAAKLAHLCQVAAMTLRAFLATKRRTAFQVPVSIERGAIEAVFESISVCGNTVGPLKGALKLIVKNVWDFDEMARRGIARTEAQIRGARAAIREIVASVNCIITRCRR